MYRALVRWMMRRQLANLRRDRLDRFMMVFDEGSRFRLAGDHELGGEQRGVAEIRAVLELMCTRLPDLTVTPVRVVSQGWPWSTVVASRLEIRATLPDGSPYRNEALQMASVRWGKVVEDRIHTDVDVLRSALAAAPR